MVSLGHDTGPAFLTHKGSLSQLAQLPFSCGGGWGVLNLHSAPLATFQGGPRVGQRPVKIIQQQREPLRQLCSPWRPLRTGHNARIVTAVMSIVTNWKHPKC